MAYARPVTVMPVHDQAHPSTLYVPLGQPGGAHLGVSSRSQPSPREKNHERDLQILYEVLKVEE
jgi:hypothetical protein